MGSPTQGESAQMSIRAGRDRWEKVNERREKESGRGSGLGG
jgi:hypothetical protein